MGTIKKYFTDESLETLVASIQASDDTILENAKIDSTTKDVVILSSAQNYTDVKIDNKPGLKTNGMTYTDANGSTQTCADGEVFNSYGTNITLTSNGLPLNGNLASGRCSTAMGMQTASAGDATFTTGYHTKASGICSTAMGYLTIANSYQHTFGKYNTEKTGCDSYDTQDSTHADAVFIVGCGTSLAAKNGFRVSSSGECFGSSTFGAAGADFAELFEWADGNPNNEDRRGLFVSLDGDKIKLANADDDYIGVISGAQAFVGNSASEEWQGKYLTDVFGTKIFQEIEVPEKIDELTGKVIPAHTITQYVLNPDYNPDEEYIMRENRKEWGIVGLLGQIVIIDDGTCVVGGHVKPSINGIGTSSDNGYRVMKRIDENHIKILVK